MADFEVGIDLNDRTETAGHVSVEVDGPEYATVSVHLFSGAGSTFVCVKLTASELLELSGAYQRAAKALSARRADELPADQGFAKWLEGGDRAAAWH
jgi:hypothetical protein